MARRHYLGSLGEFDARFSTDVGCLDYLELVRWSEGFVCPEVSPFVRERSGYAVEPWKLALGENLVVP